MEMNYLVALTLSLVVQLQYCKVAMKSARTALENRDDMRHQYSGTVFRQQPSTTGSDQCKLNKFVSAQPPDWSKVDFTQQLSAAPQLQSQANQVLLLLVPNPNPKTKICSEYYIG